MTANLFLAPIVQIAYLVPDARAAAAAAATDGVAGPFFVNERIDLAWGEHRGSPARFLHTSAYGQCGGVMLEFVQPDDDGPSPFHEGGPDTQGIHHVATIVPSLGAAYRHYERLGLATAARAATAVGHTEFAFIDAVSQLGHFIEIYEAGTGLAAFYRMVSEASRDWDGRDPVRTLG
ncbi:MAG: hypothetical protein AAF515_10225 [Pseudomonadota bacterium]